LQAQGRCQRSPREVMVSPMTCYDLWLLMLELKPEGERREGIK